MNHSGVGGDRNRKGSRASSASVHASFEKRATHKPVIVEGIGEGKLITVHPSQFKLLDVDPAYQRGATTMVTQIYRALQAGGKVIDPVTLCKRKGTGDRMWIVDGHQRVCAYQQAAMPFQAMLHESDDVESEKSLFIALNSKRALSANVIVKAWTGPVGNMLRKANESMEHPLYGRINFTQSASDSKIAASSLVRSVLCVIGVDKSGGRVEQNLSRIDMAMSKPLNKAKVEHFLRLIGRVSPSGTLPALVLRAIGTIADERWDKTENLSLPTNKSIEKMRTKQWGAEVMLVEKYLVVLLENVRKAWKA